MASFVSCLMISDMDNCGYAVFNFSYLSPRFLFLQISPVWKFPKFLIMLDSGAPCIAQAKYPEVAKPNDRDYCPVGGRFVGNVRNTCCEDGC